MKSFQFLRSLSIFFVFVINFLTILLQNFNLLSSFIKQKLASLSLISTIMQKSFFFYFSGWYQSQFSIISIYQPWPFESLVLSSTIEEWFYWRHRRKEKHQRRTGVECWQSKHMNINISKTVNTRNETSKKSQRSEKIISFLYPHKCFLQRLKKRRVDMWLEILSHNIYHNFCLIYPI